MAKSNDKVDEKKQLKEELATALEAVATARETLAEAEMAASPTIETFAKKFGKVAKIGADIYRFRKNGGIWVASDLEAV